jgi:hypothetical protein
MSRALPTPVNIFKATNGWICCWTLNAETASAGAMDKYRRINVGLAMLRFI